MNHATNRNDFLANRHGTFEFLPDNPSPTQFTQMVALGESVSRLRTSLYAAFVQDQWKGSSFLTLNLGLRWDYADALGFTTHADNIAPRLGFSLDPWHSGRTVIRGADGRYHDSAYVQFARNDMLADRLLLLRIDNPPYTAWTPGTPYVNPRDSGIPANVIKEVRRVIVKDVPRSDQASLGTQLTIASFILQSASRRLLRCRAQPISCPQRNGSP